MPFDMGDYVEVSERLANLFAKHPEASMRGTYDVLTIGSDTFIAYRAECYRTADDAAPGVGTAWEPVPGKTPYTKGSELQNAETSAWGRAIVAVGASESKRIASANEVRSAQANQNAGGQGRGGTPTAESADTVDTNAPRPSAPSQKNRRQALKARCVALTADGVSVADAREAAELPIVDSCNEEQLKSFEQLVDMLEQTIEAPFAEAKS